MRELLRVLLASSKPEMLLGELLEIKKEPGKSSEPPMLLGLLKNADSRLEKNVFVEPVSYSLLRTPEPLGVLVKSGLLEVWLHS